ncbi:MAG TPA: spore coat U domain-containing protein [Oculatellaceae cyanobacterium]
MSNQLKSLWLTSCFLFPFLYSLAAEAQSCSIDNLVGVNFGTYNIFNSSPTTTLGSISYQCTGATTVTIDLSRGNANSYTPRQMVKGSDALIYNLFLDSSYSTIWGDGTGGTSHHVSVSPSSNTSVNVPIFGSIPARQNPSVGYYTDTITVTVSF